MDETFKVTIESAIVIVAINVITMKINAFILTLLSQNQQEKSVFQLLNQRLFIKNGEHVPIVHTHLEDKVRYGRLGFSVQREGKTSSKHLLWHKGLKCGVLTKYVKGTLVPQ